MGPTWVLSAPDGPHVGPINLAIRGAPADGLAPFGSRLSAGTVKTTQIAQFMGPTWGPSGSCLPQMGPMLAPWTLLSGNVCAHYISRTGISRLPLILWICLPRVYSSAYLHRADCKGDILQLMPGLLRADRHVFPVGMYSIRLKLHFCSVLDSQQEKHNDVN